MLFQLGAATVNTILLLICGLLALAASAPGSGRIFETVTEKTAESLCPTEFAVRLPDLPKPDGRSTDFLVERSALSGQTEHFELTQLLSALQQAVIRNRLAFNVSETNRRLPRKLVEAPDARPRLCPPIYEMDASGLVEPRVPALLLTVACSDGCRPVRRDVPVYRLLCNATSPVFFRALAGVTVDCAPNVPDSW